MIERWKFCKKHAVPPHGEMWFLSNGRQVTNREAQVWAANYLTQLIEEARSESEDPLLIRVGHLEPIVKPPRANKKKSDREQKGQARTNMPSTVTSPAKSPRKRRAVRNLIRTRNLLLAALNLWELKRGFLDQF